jgi:hypothetical protein
MAELDDFIDAFEKMDINTIKVILLKNDTALFAEFNFFFNYLSAAFAVMEALGNTELKLSKKFYRVFTSPDDHSKKTIYHNRCKFLGNKTKQHISVFIDVFEDEVIRWYDCTDVKKKVGEIPIDDLQIICVPFEDMRCSCWDH